jgi:GNAT superfamily N-acetyltransferase
MNLKQLISEEIEEIYKEHMKKDFPPEELKPIDIIKKLIKKKIYMCYGLYDNDKLLAYALLVISKSYLLIDYYAVCKEYRSAGVGSEFLNLLKEQFKDYNGIIVEVEKVECAPDEEERVIRERRITFYNRNGMRMTNISVLLFNVNFSIMCFCNDELDDGCIREGLEDIYKQIIPENLYSKYVKFIY